MKRLHARVRDQLHPLESCQGELWGELGWP